MRRPPVLISLGLLVALGVTPCVDAQRSTDQVHTLRGSPTRGTVTATAPAGVTVDVNGTPQNIPVSQIKRIVYAGEPNELSRARENVLTGQLELAYSELQKLNPSTIQNKFAQADLLFYRAYCQGKLALRGGGDKGAAAGAMLNVMRVHRNTYHYYAAAELLGDLALALENYPNAARYYGVLAANGPTPEIQMRGGVLEGQSLLAQGQYAEALTKFDGVINKGVDTPEATKQKRLAQVGKAVSVSEAGDPDGAIATLDELIRENNTEDPEAAELFARAYNAKGRCHLKASRPKEALRSFLHTDLLFYTHPDAHAEALYHLSKLWGTAANKADRANNAKALLSQRYAGSVWAKRE